MKRLAIIGLGLALGACAVSTDDQPVDEVDVAQGLSNSEEALPSDSPSSKQGSDPRNNVPTQSRRVGAGEDRAGNPEPVPWNLRTPSSKP